ncbi:metalloregulator ArsR/SmtB family transcription factor [Arthrobacter sp. FW306-05-C]|uniref:metalloregulator ArsR/SmtB family transcription factor n=1 Tax=Arthrobacter sp. FW306-05-C TaxID=2879620 RepID=UPI001EFF7F87|nr:metalloregulator ArsR/SmtB family transcription factor [Arthrobacter sp. FW306-05-C]UKA65960.1 metalloregulator ArsR/SmtB family transcription factor [Arthrobacter sp. FW306-05-C]
MTKQVPDADGARPSMLALAEVFKAAAHPVRAQVLDTLSHGGSSIPELCAATGEKASHLSRHLAQLRSQRLIECQRSEGRLMYRLASPEVANLLAAARSVLQAQVAAAVVRANYTPRRTHNVATPMPAPPGVPGTTPATFSDEQFAELEHTLASRAVIADACEAIAARCGFTLDEAAKHLIMTARNANLTLRAAAAQELQNAHHGTGS